MDAERLRLVEIEERRVEGVHEHQIGLQARSGRAYFRVPFEPLRKQHAV
jgi:hypothetical protein